MPPAESNPIYKTDKGMQKQGQRSDTDSSRKQRSFERVLFETEVEHFEQSDRLKLRLLNLRENTDMDKTSSSTAKKILNEGEISYIVSNVEPQSLIERHAAEELANAST